MCSIQAVVASGEAGIVRGSCRSLSARGREPRDTGRLSAEQCRMTSFRTVVLVQRSSRRARIRPTGVRVRYGGRSRDVLSTRYCDPGVLLWPRKLSKLQDPGQIQVSIEIAAHPDIEKGAIASVFLLGHFLSAERGQQKQKRAAWARRLDIASRN